MGADVQKTPEQIEQEFNNRAQALRDHQLPGGNGQQDYRELMESLAPPMSAADKQMVMTNYLHMTDLYTQGHQLMNAQPPDYQAAQALMQQARAMRDSMRGGPGDRALTELHEMMMTADRRAVFGPGWGDGGGPHGQPSNPDWAVQIGKDFPQSGRIQAGVGDVQQGAGDYRGAQESYQHAVSLDPKNKNAWSGLSQAQLQLGDYTGAVQSGMKVLELDPNNFQAKTLLKMYADRAAPSNGLASAPGANAASHAGEPAPGAFRSFSAPTVVNQNRGREAPVTQGQADSVRLTNEADRLLNLQDGGRAEQAARKAVAAEPHNLYARFALLQALIAQRHMQEALEASQKALLEFPGNPKLTAMEVNILSRMGRYTDALAAADLGLAANPGSSAVLWARAGALSGLGRYDEARTTARQAAQDPAWADKVRQAMQIPDDQLLAFLTGDPALMPKKAVEPVAPRRDHWAGILGGVLAGALLIVLGFAQSGSTWVTGLKRSLGRLGSASVHTQQQFPVGAPPAPDGLAASGIHITRKIGQGGMGVVYEGKDTSLERPVAIKKMREEIRSDPRERERFIREAKTVAGLRHPNIVEIYQIVEDGSDVYLVFEFVTGKTVHDLISENGRLPFAYGLGVVRAVSAALDYAHRRGVIHRDLKPANIMVEEDGLVKVMDFGVARQAKDSLARMSMTNTVVGTPPYMAPEQEQGVVRKESDVYALAVCLFEMVTGRLPFQGVGAGMLMAKLNATFVPASRLVADLPAGFDEVMAKALSPDPEKRLRTAAELVKALESLPVA